MLDYILSLLGNVATYLQSATGAISGFVTSMAGAVAGYVEQIIGSVGGALSSLVGNIQRVVVDIVQGVLSTLHSVLDPILTSVQGIVEEVRSFFADILNRLREVVVGLWERVTSAIGEAINKVYEVAQAVVSNIEAAFKGVVDWIASLIESVKATVTEWYQSTMQAVRDLVANVSGKIAELLSSVVGRVSASIQKQEDYIKQGWERLFGGSEAIIDKVSARLTDVRSGMGDIAEDLVKGLQDLTKEQRKAIEDIGDNLSFYLKTMFEPQKVAGEATYFQQSIASLFDRKGIGELSAMLGDVAKRLPGPIAFILFAMLYAFSATSILGAVTGDIAQVYAQEWRAAHHPTILSAPDAIAAWRHGAMTLAEAEDVLSRQGYDAADTHRMIEASNQPPAPFDLVSMYRRGIIDSTALHAGLRQAGIGEEWEDRLVALTEIIPPPQDLIHMAVREAFSPDIAAAFGQFEDFPEEFAHYAELQGLSAEWTKRYWAAHWSLPSPQQGFEMLHRRVRMRDGSEFGQAQLDMLLRALDVMPAWRGPLTQIAYRPYTRVDIRRMHKVGVLTDEDLPRVYGDIGYDGEHAQALADFTILLNKGKATETATELGKLTRGSIISFYRDGLLDHGKAVTLLREAGLTADAAELYIAAADLAEESEQRKDRALLIQTRALNGLISETQAVSEAREAGLSESEILVLQSRIVRERSKNVKLPSRSEGERMYSLGIIGRNVYESLLRSLGFAETWIPPYLALADRALAEQIGKAQ